MLDIVNHQNPRETVKPQIKSKTLNSEQKAIQFWIFQKYPLICKQMELTWSDTEPGRRRSFHQSSKSGTLILCYRARFGSLVSWAGSFRVGFILKLKKPKYRPAWYKGVSVSYRGRGEEERDDGRCRRSSSMHWRSAERRGGVRCFATTATTWALAVVFVCFQLRSELGPHQVVSGFHVLQSHLLFLFAFCEMQNQVGGWVDFSDVVFFFIGTWIVKV